MLSASPWCKYPNSTAWLAACLHLQVRLSEAVARAFCSPVIAPRHVDEAKRLLKARGAAIHGSTGLMILVVIRIVSHVFWDKRPAHSHLASLPLPLLIHMLTLHVHCH
jgi:hypothetical protein